MVSLSKIFKRGHSPDILLLVVGGFLIVFGLVMLASASSHIAQAQFGDPYFYLTRQVIRGVLLGLILFFITSKVHYRVYSHKAISVGFFLFTLLLVLLVFTPLGISANGAQRWLSIGSFSFQPAELLKISLVIYLAAWMSQKGYRQVNVKKGLIPFVAVMSFILVVLVLQRSTSPVFILLLVSVIMYFMSGAKLKYLFGFLVCAFIVMSLIVKISPYRADRFFNYLNPEDDPSGSGFHAIQAKTAIGAGGLIGVGYGKSTVKFLLPEPIGDSIFAVMAEEFGFIGSTFLLLLFSIFVIRIYVLSTRVRDDFGRLLLIGFASLIGIQACVNIGAMTGVLPLTGTPLPFISYGSTALAIFIAMLGIIINISKYTRRS
ncbi:MAG: stage V sporulation protein E [Candidatus Harrisonbacteria bacterium CG10_big_fil_rev_8_21_14_0_10_38_8]|uniref:Probable peptidoglycan glycosyltransferase FtsW n=1 Tax=Candidatus Harrisonbacteria bacterium CG10_big_fil_rev_8_21_14_0_10_38_8 TaxID=1974582 RepID=A0A2M6WKS0_9BACT|nr:MAG: stage V sporulation protein E [Candidatus Harrisonbacteria bacterium CG10_big_fil_rev_8_21_14_0_10_38_8]